MGWLDDIMSSDLLSTGYDLGSNPILDAGNELYGLESLYPSGVLSAEDAFGLNGTQTLGNLGGEGYGLNTLPSDVLTYEQAFGPQYGSSYGPLGEAASEAANAKYGQGSTGSSQAQQSGNRNNAATALGGLAALLQAIAPWMGRGSAAPAHGSTRAATPMTWRTMKDGGSTGANSGCSCGALGLLKGGQMGQADGVPIMGSHGEYMMDADTVSALGDGNTDAGAKRLDQMRENIRKHKRSAPPTSIPPKAKSPLAYLNKGA